MPPVGRRAVVEAHRQELNLCRQKIKPLELRSPFKPAYQVTAANAKSMHLKEQRLHFAQAHFHSTFFLHIFDAG